MDPQTVKLVQEWKETLTPQERELHELAAVMLKKTLVPKDMPDDKDNGSYYVEKCHAFKSWLKTKTTKK
jgi:hypothetical protein